MVILVIFFSTFLFKVNILPLKYFICTLLILILWLVGLYFLLIFKEQLSRKITGYVFSVFCLCYSPKV